MLDIMRGARDQRSLAREANFLEFAREIAEVATMPLMVTGGIRRRAARQYPRWMAARKAAA